ncbi:MAG: IclR family transcriptional regulator [Candidatus Limnocylindria bacterium]
MLDHEEPGEPPSGAMGSVARVVRLLEAVATSDANAGVRALARQSGIDKSAVSRLLRQLTELDVLEPSDVAGRYHIGPRFFALARAVANRDDLGRAAQPILERLVATYNETSYMAVRERDEVFFREKVECDQPIRYVIDERRPSPIHAGSAGRAILSALSDEEFEETLERLSLDPVTPHTITDRAELRRRRAEDRQRGFTVSVAERSVGGCGVAAPFLGSDGRCLGSLVITMPQIRFFPASIDVWGAAMVRAADELSRRLGHPSGSGEGIVPTP